MAIATLNQLEITSDYDLDRGYNCVLKIDSTHVLWCGQLSAVTLSAIVVALDASYNISVTSNSALTIDSSATVGSWTGCLTAIPGITTHVLYAVRGKNNDGYLAVLTWDENYKVTCAAFLEHDTTLAGRQDLVWLDSTHFFLSYAGASEYGRIKTFSINTSTWAITELSNKQITSVACYTTSCAVIDSTHVLYAYQSTDSDGFLNVATINASTFAITTGATPLEHDTTYCIDACLRYWKSDATKAYFYLGYRPTSNTEYLQRLKIISVNLSTYAMTQEYSGDVSDGTKNSNQDAMVLIPYAPDHLVMVRDRYSYPNYDTKVYLIRMNSITGLTVIDSVTYTTGSAYNLHSGGYLLDRRNMIVIFKGLGNDGYAQTLNIDRWVKRINGTFRFAKVNGTSTESIQKLSGMV